MSFNPNIIDQLKEQKFKILDKAEEYGVSDIRVFGSVVRNDESSSSDVDLLIHVERDSGISMFGLAKLQEELEQLIGRPVDLVLDDTLHPAISERILKEAQPL